MGKNSPALFRDWRSLPAEAGGCAVALGNFDGVHLGHQYLLNKIARACPSAPLGVLTFFPHPKSFFRPQDPPFQLLRTGRERADYLGAYGVKNVFEIEFNAALSTLAPEIFVEEILLKSLGVQHVGCGADFRFGHRRLGNVDLLGKILSRHGVGLTDSAALCDSEGPVSSTRIRRALQEGYPEKAAACLGRFWCLSGEVLHGDKRGRQLGFPTANVALGDYIEPARGAYVCAVKIQGALGADSDEIHYGIANIGRRPTINEKQQSRIEAHLFDFSGDLYGKNLKIFLLKHLRDEKRFENLEALKAQIKADADQARKWLEDGNNLKIPFF